MILQALDSYYHMLLERGEISPPGWAPAKVAYALHINSVGELEHVSCLREETTVGTKAVVLTKVIEMPAGEKRTTGITPHFLCDHCGYMLGISSKDELRAQDCFKSSRAYHTKLLKDVESPAAKALLCFFNSWNPLEALEHPALQEYKDDILSGSNLIFMLEDEFIHLDPDIREAWQKSYDNASDELRGICMVTGEVASIANIHPSVKGIRGAQSSGAALVTFNAPCLSSYGKYRGMNAPISRDVAFSYTAALNYLISHREHVHHVGDTTVLFWAESVEPAYQELADDLLFGDPELYSSSELSAMLSSLLNGERVEYDGTKIDPSQTFCILGIAPNAARLSIRFFLHNSFGHLIENIQAHYDRLEISRSKFDKLEYLPIWTLINDAIPKALRSRPASAIIEDKLFNAVLRNTSYPSEILYEVMHRIRVEGKVTRGRAAILKAYYIQSPNLDVPKEVLTVSLNPDSKNTAYNLGRLFALLEAIQRAALPGISATIRDRFLAGAAATPSTVFPRLLNLTQKHLKKLTPGLSIYYKKELEALVNTFGEEYPTRLNLAQQGSFYLGYYHQMTAQYQAKNKEEN